VKFPVSLWTAAEATQISVLCFLVVFYLTLTIQPAMPDGFKCFACLPLRSNVSTFLPPGAANPAGNSAI